MQGQDGWILAKFFVSVRKDAKMSHEMNHTVNARISAQLQIIAQPKAKFVISVPPSPRVRIKQFSIRFLNFYVAVWF